MCKWHQSGCSSFFKTIFKSSRDDKNLFCACGVSVLLMKFQSASIVILNRQNLNFHTIARSCGLPFSIDLTLWPLVDCASRVPLAHTPKIVIVQQLKPDKSSLRTILTVCFCSSTLMLLKMDISFVPSHRT